ncbi:MAG: cysteine-rich CWC family protein [Nitrospirota bacterium]
MTKTCEHCRQPFSCGGYQCWCGKIGITEAQMDWIAARFQDCLCPTCLQLVADGVLGPEVSQQKQVDLPVAEEERPASSERGPCG